MLDYTQNSEVLSYSGYNSSHVRFDNKCIKNIESQLSPTTKSGIIKEKQKDLKFFLPFLNQENQE